MRTTAEYENRLQSAFQRYSSAANELPIILAFSLLGLMLCLLAAMYFPDIAPPAEFQSILSTDASTAV
jgi:hypothetical protein